MQKLWGYARCNVRSLLYVCMSSTFDVHLLEAPHDELHMPRVVLQVIQSPNEVTEETANKG